MPIKYQNKLNGEIYKYYLLLAYFLNRHNNYQNKIKPWSIAAQHNSVGSSFLWLNFEALLLPKYNDMLYFLYKKKQEKTIFEPSIGFDEVYF